TVYRPHSVVPGQWFALLAFAHLAKPDIVRQVGEQAQRVLGEIAARHYQALTVDSFRPIPSRSVLTFVPRVDGIEFNPPERSFVWSEAIHREEFRCRADAALAEGAS